MRWPLAILLLGVAASAMADRALVVGVGGYPNLHPFDHLEGPPDDARRMDGVLEKLKFEKRILLVEQNAQQQKIADALTDIETNITPTERFVFYFAGHGTNTPTYGLLPWEAQKTTDGRMSSEWLHARMLAIRKKCRSVTVILDACYAGGFTKSGDSDRIRVRSYNPPSFSKGPERANESDRAEPVAANSGVCYVTAAKSNEAAIEFKWDSQDKKKGLFTKFLCDRLQDISAATNMPWEGIISIVRGEIQETLTPFKRVQNPAVSPPFSRHKAFNPGDAPGPPLIPANMLEFFNLDKPNAQELSLLIEPDTSLLKVGQRFKVKVDLKSSGYVVILAQRAGKFERIWPPDNDTELLTAKTPITRTFFGDATGQDAIRAFLFKSKPDLATVYSMFPSDTQFGLREMSKDIKAIDGEDYYTSSTTLAFEIGLIGNANPGDKAMFWDLLKSKTGAGKAFYSSLMALPSIATRLEDFVGKKDLQTDDSYSLLLNLILGDFRLPRLLQNADLKVDGVAVEDKDVIANNIKLLKQVCPGLLN